MKIKLLVSRCGVDGAQNRGDEIEVSDNEAKRMIEAGQATPLRLYQEPEKAIRRGRPQNASKVE